MDKKRNRETKNRLIESLKRGQGSHFLDGMLSGVLGGASVGIGLFVGRQLSQALAEGRDFLLLIAKTPEQKIVCEHCGKELSEDRPDGSPLDYVSARTEDEASK